MSEQAESNDHAPQRIARRKLLVSGFAALLGGGLLFRVVSRPARARRASAAGAATQPRAGGALRVAFDGAAVATFGLDPHHSGFAPHNRVIRAIYDNLTVLLPDQTLAPWLAESWQISPDLTQYTFKLRTGVRFHDGTPLDAAAVKANFDRLADPDNALNSRTSLGPYARSEVLAPQLLRVTLSQPFTPFLRNLSMSKLAIVSPAAVAKHGKLFSLNPVGSGPFRFKGLKQGTEIRLERNPEYRWAPGHAAHPGPAWVDSLTFLNVPEESTRIAVLRSGQVQVSDLIPPQNLAALRADEDYALLEQELLETNYALALNVLRKPWDDEEMRQAVKLSLDIDTIVRVIYQGTFVRAWSALSPSMLGSSERALAKSWQPDPARAAAILERKGWKLSADGVREKDGQRLTIRFIDSQGNREKRLDVLQLVRRQLASNGIALTIDTQPPAMYQAKLANNEYDLAAGASFHADPDILRQSYVPEFRAVLSGNKVDDPEIVAWLNRAAREPDGAQRVALYQQVQRKILDKTYSIPIYVLQYNLAASKQVHGLRIDAHGFPEFGDVWLDPRVEA